MPRNVRLKRRIVLFILLAAIVVATRPAIRHARAASLLMAFADAKAPLTAVEEAVTIGTTSGHARARLYSPPGAAANAPALVLVHGVHRLGIDDPRMRRFANALVGAGVRVLTPHVDELADYRVAPSSIDTLGASVRWLRERSGARVGLIGMSFSGGLSLLTAADSRFADDVSFVVAVGAHDDLERVSRFFVTDTIEDHDRAPHSLRAHEYGATILVYTYIEDFFPPEDAPKAKEALRLWLWEKRDDARTIAQSLPSPSKETLEKLFAADVASVKPKLLDEIARHTPEMKAVSPHDRLASLHVPAYILHGEGDTVIPATEATWLAADVPKGSLKSVLVSPALVHVELKPDLMQQWALVHFMGSVLGEAYERR